MEFLLYSTGQAILALCRFADEKEQDGSMKKARLIVPGMRRTRKWLMNMLTPQDESTEHTPDNSEAGATNIYYGDSLQARKDPEHLPPTNLSQRIGNKIRGVSHLLGSPYSGFGFRAACATLSIGIIAYLETTQRFFVEQRLFWAMIMVSIGMTQTAGSGVFGFFGRIAGTVIAMCTSLIIWYIVDGKTGGVLPMFWLFTCIPFYFLLKFPRFTIICLLTSVTQVLILGYELQVRKIGVILSTSNGQLYYPVYELAPYRLACVAGGMAVACFWTFFPYPLTTRSAMRKDLGASLYLLANYYSCVHTTTTLRLAGTSSDMEKGSAGQKLEKARVKVFAKQMALIAGLQAHSSFIKWEPSFGGKFPKQKYENILKGVQRFVSPPLINTLMQLGGGPQADLSR